SQDAKTLAVVSHETGWPAQRFHSTAAPRNWNGSTIRLIDLASGKDLQPRGEDQAGHFGTALTPDRRTAATITRDNAVLLWDPVTGRERGRLQGHTQLVTAIGILPDGRSLVSASVDGTLRVWDLGACKEVRRLQVPFVLLGLLAISADGKTLAIE